MRENGRKRAEKLAAALCLAIAMTPAATAAETIRLTNGEWQPYLSEHVPHHGLASHIITEAFTLVNVDVTYGFFPWKRSFKLAKKGEHWHGSAAWFHSEERARDFHISNPVTEARMAFFHLKDFAFDWQSIEDLRGTKIGATMEYYYGKEFHDAIDSEIIRPEWAATDEINLKKLLKSRIEVFPGAILVTYSQIQASFDEKDAARFMHHPRAINTRPLHLILSKANPDNERLIDLFNSGLKLLKESGRYDEIVADGLAGKYTRPR